MSSVTCAESVESRCRFASLSSNSAIGDLVAYFGVGPTPEEKAELYNKESD